MMRALPKLIVIVGVIAACVIAVAPKVEERFGPLFPAGDHHLVTVTAINETKIDPQLEQFIADLCHSRVAKWGRLHVDMTDTDTIRIDNGVIEFNDPIRVTYVGWLVRPSTTVTRIYSEPEHSRVRIDVDGLPDYFLTSEVY